MGRTPDPGRRHGLSAELDWTELGAESQRMDEDEAMYAIQQAAERHLMLCWDAADEQEDAEAGVEIPSPAVGPYCGCQTCLVREVLAGAWPKIEEYFAMRVSEPRS